MSGPLEIWYKVPLSSTIQIGITADGDLLGQCKVDPSDEILSHTDLISGPVQKVIDGPKTYLVTVEWQGEPSSCEIYARLYDPEGNLVLPSSDSSEYRYSVQGEHGVPNTEAKLVVTV